MNLPLTTSRNLAPLCVLLAMLPLAGARGQAPLNDNFANRFPIAGSSVAISVTNAGATKETDEGSHIFFASEHSVWLTWTAPATGGATITGRNNYYRPILAVYSGSALTNLTRLANNISDYAQNLVVFNAIAGTPYQIVVDSGSAADTGVMDLELALTPPPGNDYSTNATVIPGLIFDTRGSFKGATLETNEPNHGHPEYQQTLWWSWTAPGNLGVTNWPVRIIADAVSYAPDIGVYQGTNFSPLTTNAPTTVTDGMTRVTSFTATAGATYLIALGGQHHYPGGNNISQRFGDYRLRLYCHALALSVANLSTTDNGTVDFSADVAITNFGSASSGPLRLLITTNSGVSVKGVDSGYSYENPGVVLTTNLAGLSPNQGTVQPVSGSVPTPVGADTDYTGIGYGAYAELQEQLPDQSWITLDETLLLFGGWPGLGGYPGPDGGVIRLDPGLTSQGLRWLHTVNVIGSTNIPEGSATNYYGRATYTDGDSFAALNFTNTEWTTSRFNVTNGLFTAGSVTSDTTVTLTAKYSLSGYYSNGVGLVTVSDLPPPKLKLPQLLWKTNFTLQLEGVPNRKHVIEASTNLTSATNWVPLRTNQPGATGLLNFTNAVGTNPQQFFRARELE